MKEYTKNPWVVLIALTIVLFGGAILLAGPAEPVADNSVAAEVITHTKGSADAAVVLIEYSDFQCPACATFQPVLAELLTQYEGKLRLEFKHFPLLSIHPHAQSAAIAAEAAGQQGKFFEFHDILFARQPEWGAASNPSTFYVRYAEELGLDLDLFRDHLRSSTLRDVVRSGFDEARELGLTGTPTFFLNGERLEFQTYEEFVGQIAFAVDPEAFASSTDQVAPVAAPDVKFGI